MPKLKTISITKDKHIILSYNILLFEKMTQMCHWSFHLETEAYVQIAWNLQTGQKNYIFQNLKYCILSVSFFLCSEINIKVNRYYSNFEIIFQLFKLFCSWSTGHWCIRFQFHKRKCDSLKKNLTARKVSHFPLAICDSHRLNIIVTSDTFFFCI